MIPATVTYLDGVPPGPDGQTITTWNSGIYDGIYLILAISILLSHSLQGFRMVSESYEYISAGSSWCKIFSITSMCINPIPIVARWGCDVCDQTDPVWLLWRVLGAKMRIELNDWKIYINIYIHIYISSKNGTSENWPTKIGMSPFQTWAADFNPEECNE